LIAKEWVRRHVIRRSIVASRILVSNGSGVGIALCLRVR
jgi:hypothetical protein